MTDGWNTAWLVWLAIFLALEVPAALSKAPGKTLSEHVWGWFGTPGRRVVLGLFWVALGVHLIWHATVIPVIVGGALVLLCILIRMHPRSPDAFDWAKDAKPLPKDWKP